MGYLTWVFCRIYEKYGRLEDYLKLKDMLTDLKTAKEIYLKLSARKPKKKSFETFLKSHEEDWKWIEKNKIRVLLAGDESFPKLHLEREIFCLYLWGRRPLLCKNNFSVIGARKVSQKTLKWLDSEFKDLIESFNLITVSGGAIGTDQKIHSLSLSLSQPTICFLPSGMRKIYPYNLKNWTDPILENGGLLVSQFAPSEELRPYHFYLRNQLIVAVSKALFVVQAQQRSGSMMTASHAFKMGKDLCTLPFFPKEGGCGNLDLIWNGASPLRDKLDLQIFLERNSYSAIKKK